MKRFKNFLLKELTISPFYKQKNVYNPYYDIDKKIEAKVKKELKKRKVKFKKVLFKSVENGKGTLVDIGDRGQKFIFQLVNKDGNKEKDIPLFIKLRTVSVKGHYGMKQRKDSTASSNVNELLSVYFLKHKKYTDAQSFMFDIGRMSGGTGIFTGEDKEITYLQLKQLLDRDETAERDIDIGYKNSIAIQKDLKSENQKWKKLYWTPRGKPADINKNNPSDVILDIGNNNYIGYSNKIATGKDTTPKFNTNVKAFFGQVDGDNNKYQKQVIKFIDDSWKKSVDSVPKSAKNATAALKDFDITKEKASETSSRDDFSRIAREFEKDDLNFYGKDFYYEFRNNFIQSLGKSLTKANNMNYFLKTVGSYTFKLGDINDTPCPYKLLVGSIKGASKIKEISSDEGLKELLLNDDPKQFSNIKFDHTGGQGFVMSLNFKLLNYEVTIPITARTRAQGGWAGKALYIQTPGIKVKI